MAHHGGGGGGGGASPPGVTPAELAAALAGSLAGGDSAEGGGGGGVSGASGASGGVGAAGGEEGARQTTERNKRERENAPGEDEMNMFVAVTAADVETARFYLESCGGDVEAAVATFFAAMEGGPVPMDADAAVDEGEDGDDDDDDDDDDDLLADAEAAAAAAAAPEPPPAEPEPEGAKAYSAPPQLPAWLAHDASAAPPDHVPLDDTAAAMATLSAILGVAVAPAAQGTPPASALLFPTPNNAAVKRNVESMLRALLSRRRTLVPNTSEVRILALVHARSMAALRSLDPAAKPDAANLVKLTAFCAASILAELLAADDGDDLFFEGGQHRHAFREALADATATDALVNDMVATSAATPSDAARDAAKALWEELLKSTLAGFGDVRLDDLASLDARLRSLSTLIGAAPVLRLLAKMLHGEAARAHALTGVVFEKMSVLAPLLKVGTLPTTPNGPSPPAALATFTSLRGYPQSGERGRVLDVLAQVFERTHGAAHTILRMLAGAGAEYKETALAWLAAAMGTSHARTKVGASSAAAALSRGARSGASDAFALGVAAVCLRFCRPFLDAKPQHMARLAAAPLTQPRRLPVPAGEETLAGRTNMPEAPAADDGAANLPPPRPYFAPRLPAGAEPMHFVLECYFLAQYAQHVCVLPATTSLVRRLRAKERHSKRDGASLNDDPAWNAEVDCGSAQLLDPGVAVDLCRFSLITAVWLLALLERSPAGAVREAFACLPEFVAKDLGLWVTHVLRWNRADLLAGAGSTTLPVTTLVECATALLLRRDLVRSPIVHARLCEMLENFLRATRRSGGLGSGAGSSAHDALVGAVLGNAAVLGRIVPALMSAYVAMDAVEGIDVDAEDFDKFASRNDVGRLIETIWGYPECQASVQALLAADHGRDLFAQFASSALGALMYLLEDSLERLVSIHEMELAMADKAAWNALPANERADKEGFLRSQEGAARGFMKYAINTLRLLNLLAEADGVGAAFLSEGTVGQAAYAVVHFLELLVGPKGSNLKVDRPERFSFKPNELLLSVVEFALRIATRHPNSDRFAGVVASEPDFDASILRTAGATMVEHGIGGPGHHECLAAFVAAAEAGASKPVPTAVGERPAFADEAPEGDDAWKREYVAAMRGHAFADVEDGLQQYYGLFEELANQPAGNQKQKLRKLAKEVQGLCADDGLPVAPESSVLLRQDGSRPDKMRALIVGPEGTPYGLGCFVFDVYFPADYPQKPPMVQFLTTGGGRIRFNPNLYADGKVCLSLLGTWHGGAEFEKWNPAQSSLYQVLVSVQAMILVEQPWFNEPGADGLRGTSDGDRKSREYNEEIRLQTMRWGMVAQLRKPSPGFEEAIRAHFKMQRGRVYRQCAAWTAECADATRRARMEEALGELTAELGKL